MSHSLNSLKRDHVRVRVQGLGFGVGGLGSKLLKGVYLGDSIGDYYRAS